jgi:hypothetical protein
MNTPRHLFYCFLFFQFRGTVAYPDPHYFVKLDPDQYK